MKLRVVPNLSPEARRVLIRLVNQYHVNYAALMDGLYDRLQTQGFCSSSRTTQNEVLALNQLENDLKLLKASGVSFRPLTQNEQERE